MPTESHVNTKTGRQKNTFKFLVRNYSDLVGMKESWVWRMEFEKLKKKEISITGIIKLVEEDRSLVLFFFLVFGFYF